MPVPLMPNACSILLLFNAPVPKICTFVFLALLSPVRPGHLLLQKFGVADLNGSTSEVFQLGVVIQQSSRHARASFAEV